MYRDWGTFTRLPFAKLINIKTWIKLSICIIMFPIELIEFVILSYLYFHQWVSVFHVKWNYYQAQNKFFIFILNLKNSLWIARGELHNNAIKIEQKTFKEVFCIPENIYLSQIINAVSGNFKHMVSFFLSTYILGTLIML